MRKSHAPLKITTLQRPWHNIYVVHSTQTVLSPPPPSPPPSLARPLRLLQRSQEKTPRNLATILHAQRNANSRPYRIVAVEILPTQAVSVAIVYWLPSLIAARMRLVVMRIGRQPGISDISFVYQSVESEMRLRL